MKRRLNNAWHYGLGYLAGHRDGKRYTERAILGPGGEYDAQAEVERLRREITGLADTLGGSHIPANAPLGHPAVTAAQYRHRIAEHLRLILNGNSA